MRVSRTALLATVLCTVCISCRAMGGVRGVARDKSPGTPPLYEPVELHNPADDMNVFRVMVSGPVEKPDHSSFRSMATVIVKQLSIVPAPAGVTVLNGNWAKNEVCRAAFNDTISQCVCVLCVRLCWPLPPPERPALRRPLCSIISCDRFGWAFLSVATNPSMPNAYQAVAAGFLEGALTQRRIYQYAMHPPPSPRIPQRSVSNSDTDSYTTPLRHFRYAVNGDAVKPFSERKRQFLHDNEAWVDAQAQAAPTSEYWDQVVLLSMQVRSSGLWFDCALAE